MAAPVRFPSVLITSASRKVSLVRAFREALAAEGGEGVVVAVDINPASAAMREADRACLVPRSDSPEFLPALRRVIRANEVGIVVPTRDEELPLFAGLRDELARDGVLVMVSPPAAVATCQDKRRFLEFCRDNGLGIPRLHDVPEQVQERDLPVFVRGRVGKGGRYALRADSLPALEAALREIPEPIVQELITLPEYTVDVFSDMQGTVRSAVVRERVLVVGGESFVGRTVRHPAVLRHTVRLCEALGLVGHTTVQCFAGDDRVLFIEVNPRYGGAASIGFAAGAPTPRWLVRLARGLPIDARLGEYDADLVALRYVEDRFTTGEALRGVVPA